jgi:hypothetical protein
LALWWDMGRGHGHMASAEGVGGVGSSSEHSVEPSANAEHRAAKKASAAMAVWALGTTMPRRVAQFRVLCGRTIRGIDCGGARA